MEDCIMNEEVGRDAAGEPRLEQDVPGERALGAPDPHGGVAETGGNVSEGTSAEGIGEGAFRIGEVSRLTGTKAFVLRYWETEFPMLQPVKSPNGHRLYRRADIETVFEIKRLLYEQGFTIVGARRYLTERNGGESAAAVGPQGQPASSGHDCSAV